MGQLGPDSKVLWQKKGPTERKWTQNPPVAFHTLQPCGVRNGPPQFDCSGFGGVKLVVTKYSFIFAGDSGDMVLLARADGSRG
jgi:hypothetical protein